MNNLWTIYHHDIPDFLLEFMNTKAMLRLKNVGMNCGVEYTSFKTFQNIHYYSRYDHSVGVALITWHFTKDMKQSIAGLFHDIATPVFAHTIDFMNGDYLTQESTESLTETIINNDIDIQKLLHKYHFTTLDVSNYHLYSICDNDSPRLSADRLEYTLGNMYNFKFAKIDMIQDIYNDITVGINEEKDLELVFHHASIAYNFFKSMMKNSRIYVCDEDRYAMESLAIIIRQAIDKHMMTMNDLYSHESHVIDKLMNNEETKGLWKEYQNYNQIITPKTKIDHKCLKVNAKKRYIDPLVCSQRLSHIYNDVSDEINEFRSVSFDYWIRAL